MRRAIPRCSTAALLLAAACGGSASVEPGAPPTYGFVPDLRGTSVMVFPVQLVAEGPRREELDRELRFAVEEAGVDWQLPEDLEQAARRSPGVDVRLRDLPVSQFLAREVRRVGDPLFGYLIRLSALTGSGVALIPVAATAERDPSGDVGWTLSAALLDARSGRVIWYGSVSGTPAAEGSPAGIASAAQALVARFAPTAVG